MLGNCGHPDSGIVVQNYALLFVYNRYRRLGMYVYVHVYVNYLNNLNARQSVAGKICEVVTIIKNHHNFQIRFGLFGK